MESFAFALLTRHPDQLAALRSEPALLGPAILAADPERGYLLLDRLHGTPLEALKAGLSPERLAQVRTEIGAFAARLHAITGPMFGYPRRDGRTRSASWREAFLAYVDDVLADAADLDVELPGLPDSIRAAIHRHAGLLAEVTTPALVHFDLDDSNVFLLPNGDGHVIEGVIDGERAFFGDPIAELVGLACFSEPEDVPGLLPGYLGRSLTDGERTRLRMYTAYMGLIMATEGATRGFDPVEHEPIRRFALDRIEAEVAQLSRLPAG